MYIQLQMVKIIYLSFYLFIFNHDLIGKKVREHSLGLKIMQQSVAVRGEAFDKVVYHHQ